MFSIGLSLTGQLKSSFSPVSLFATGSQGIWLDPSDLTTMFQDRAGTTPVTTPGQTVGLRLDKSKGLTLGSELVTNGDFGGGTTTNWTPSGTATLSVQSGQLRIDASGIFPIATQSFTTVVGKFYKFEALFNQSTSNRVCYISPRSGFDVIAATSSGTLSCIFVATATTTTITVGIYATLAATGYALFDNISVKELAGNHAVAPTDAARPTYGIEPWSGRRNLLLATDTMATQSLTVTAVAHTLAFTGTGTVALTGASIAGPLIGTGASNRVSLTFTPTAASLTLTVIGSVTLAQLELGSTATAYQRVGTAFDVTEAGVPTVHYVQYDGTDDSMSTAAIDFTATDKMSVFAGVRSLAGTTQRTLVSMGAFNGATSGTFEIDQPVNATNDAVLLNGSSYAYTEYAVSFDTGNVITAQMDYAQTTIAAETSLRRNGAALVPASSFGTSAGTGNFGNYPLFIGRRNNASLPFNGRDYGIIVVGKTASASEIYSTESYLAANTSGVSI